MNKYINRWKSNVELHNQKLKNLRSLSRENRANYLTPSKNPGTSSLGYKRDMTPPDFNRDLEQVLRETSEGRKGDIKQKKRKQFEYNEESSDEEEEEILRESKRQQNRKDATETCTEKLEQLIAQKLPKGKRKAKIKQILSSYQSELQRERDDCVIEAKKLREYKEKAQTRHDTTNKYITEINAKLVENEKGKIELRKERDSLKARVAELEQQRQAQMMSSEIVKMLKESHDSLQATNMALRDALQEQKGIFSQERAVWTTELNSLRQKLEVLKYGGGSLAAGASLMTINGSPKDSSMGAPRGTGGFLTTSRKTETVARSGNLKDSSTQHHKRENTIIESPYLVADADEDEGKESSNLSQIFRSDNKNPGFEIEQQFAE